jgi:hypothetical protein
MRTLDAQSPLSARSCPHLSLWYTCGEPQSACERVWILLAEEACRLPCCYSCGVEAPLLSTVAWHPLPLPSCHRLVIPRVGERCFVPHSLWPDETPEHTPHGVGWLATVTALTTDAVRFACDGETEPAALTRAAFRQHCGLVGELPSPTGVWWLLDEDALGAVLRACDVSSLLALEATHRGALLAVRTFWQRESWEHAELPGVESDALCLAADGDMVAVGAGCVDSPRAAAYGGAWLLWVGGERVARVETPFHVVAVAVHPVSRRVAIAQRRVEVYKLEGMALRLAAPCAVYECCASALVWSRGALLAGSFGGSVVRLPRGDVVDAWRARVSSLAAAASCLVVGYDDGAVRLVQPQRHMLRRHTGAPTLAVAATAHGTVAATRGRVVDVWRGTVHLRTMRTSGRPSALHISGCFLVVGAGRAGRIELWSGARCVGTLEGHGGAVTGIGVDDEGRVFSASVTSSPGRRALWCSSPPARLA